MGLLSIMRVSNLWSILGQKMLLVILKTKYHYCKSSELNGVRLLLIPHLETTEMFCVD